MREAARFFFGFCLRVDGSPRGGGGVRSKAFAVAAGTRDNLGRNTLTSPGLVNVDLALIKSFPLATQR
jgi:hypothetical protein